jgi:hypothetical protein
MEGQEMQLQAPVKKIFDFTMRPEFVLALIIAIIGLGYWAFTVALSQQTDIRDMRMEIRDTLNSVQALAKKVDDNRVDADKTQGRVDAAERSQALMVVNVQNIVDSLKSLRETITLGFTKSADQISDLAKAQAETHERVSVMQMQLPRQNGPRRD